MNIRLLQFLTRNSDIYKLNTVRIKTEKNIIVYKMTTEERVELIYTDDGVILENYDVIGV